MGIVADAVFDLPDPSVQPLFAWLALIAYTLQIYYDFAGYTDIAIGLGSIVGITLPENFKYPYVAQSVAEFWRRWHITLSTWFREYVFYPLERHRLRMAGQQINLVLVFLLVGLWHGPTLNYLLWGALHGLAIALESVDAGKWLKRLWRPLRHAYAMLLISWGWVFFRSSSPEFAAAFTSRLLGNQAGIRPLPFSQTTPFPFVEPFFITIALAALLFSLPLWQVWKRLRLRLEGASAGLAVALQVVEDISLVALFLFTLAAQVSGSFRPNIYARF
jgi:alginate O-acetyltransferase complex protein AlgI